MFFSPSVKTITVQDLQRKLSGGESLTVLDIRPPDRRKEWHIPASLHIDAFPSVYAGDDSIFDRVPLPTDRPVVVVCNAGVTSRKAAAMLSRRGFDAYSLEGGMNAWGTAWNVAEAQTKDGHTTVLQVRRAGKGCLSYLIGSKDAAMVVDASLDPEVYRSLAEERGWTIVKAVDTHIHADHISRTRTLAEAFGAALYLPAPAAVSYAFTPLHESEEVQVGDASLTALATPGHTPESTSYLVNNEILLTGDTLFQTGAGRPDFGSSVSETNERAHMLYHSLRRLMRDAGNATVLASHTAVPPGFDGALIGGRLNELSATNPLLALSENDFVQTILAHIPAKPSNYEKIVEYNLAGELPGDAIAELEAGANRCAAG